MGLFFGTDGLRGKVNEVLTFDVAFKIGNALSMIKENPKIVIGADTRTSNSYIVCALSGGALSGGANVIDIGIVPTAGISYITKKINADYGVVVSASHNSGEYNGIKIFDKDGYKINEKEEERIERCFINKKFNNYSNIGKYVQQFNLINLYKKYLLSIVKTTFTGKKIVLDCANGACYNIAPEIFRKLGAKVIATNAKNCGEKINYKCGAVHPEVLAKKVKKYRADLGFSFDGDSDRVIAVDENGNLIDGDMLICALAKQYKSENKLNSDTVVGTSHTNMAIEKELEKCGIKLIRTDIGDKYVLAKILEKNLSLGGEQSGHVILKEYLSTGDGILTALVITDMLVKLNSSMSKIFNIKLYPQTNLNVVVKDKFKIMNSELLNQNIIKFNSVLEGKGRILIRASGTEPKIRVMVESQNKDLNDDIAKELISIVKTIDF